MNFYQIPIITTEWFEVRIYQEPKRFGFQFLYDYTMGGHRKGLFSLRLGFWEIDVELFVTKS